MWSIGSELIGNVYWSGSPPKCRNIQQQNTSEIHNGQDRKSSYGNKKSKTPVQSKIKQAPVSETENIPKKKRARSRQNSESSSEDQREDQQYQYVVIDTQTPQPTISSITSGSHNTMEEVDHGSRGNKIQKTVNKQAVIENKQAFYGHCYKDNWAFNFRDSVNLKLSLYIVYIYAHLSAGVLKKNQK